MNIPEHMKSEVAIMMVKLGACSLTQVTARCGLDRVMVEACLHSLALDGVVKMKAAFYRQGKRIIPFVYWQSTLYEGNYYTIQRTQAEKHPELFSKKAKSSSSRVLIVERTRKWIEEGYPNEYSADDIRDSLGCSYGKALHALHDLLLEGAVVRRKEVYGRGRPRMLYSAVNGTAPEKQVYSFDDDPEAVDLE